MGDYNAPVTEKLDLQCGSVPAQNIARAQNRLFEYKVALKLAEKFAQTLTYIGAKFCAKFHLHWRKILRQTSPTFGAKFRNFSLVQKYIKLYMKLCAPITS